MEKKKKRYRVDLCGMDICYENVKSSYKKGSEVTLYYRMIFEDTEYSFYLDGKGLLYGYHPKKGFVLKFTMPEHDVTLSCYSVKKTAGKAPEEEKSES